MRAGRGPRPGCPEMGPSIMTRRTTFFIVWCGICAAGAAAYVMHDRGTFLTHDKRLSDVKNVPQPSLPSPLPSRKPPRGPTHMLVRSTAINEHYGKLAVVALG